MHGCAYNSVPEEPILAGQTHVSGTSNGALNDDLVVSCINSKLQIIDKSGSDMIKQIEIINLSGQSVNERIINRYNASFDLFGLPPSIYVVRVTSTNTVQSRLIYVN